MLTIDDAAFHLDIPLRAVRSWMRRELVEGVHAERLPLHALVQANFLRSLLKAGLSGTALADVAKDFGQLWPARHELVKAVSRKAKNVDFTQVLDEHVAFVSVDADGLPRAIRLRSYWEQGVAVVVDPRVADGQPVYEQSDVPVRDVVLAFLTGARPIDIAWEHSVQLEDVHGALRVHLELTHL
ncbi:DUF433 domain-containing protein [Allokutzneria sp. NRRL B-24872]|uniref:DUF433 domain-containing protein n=1 Tax=Allokutzneria sp. NRRL B-24872 TaxID=1137961 RepID=UPI000A3C0F74|nr:DUF433 domain-containing protein [Allokutzneria sp. NRRL B-24872]